MKSLTQQVLCCTHCAAHLPFAPRPIIQLSRTARILIIGQAPGLKVQQNGIPWQDASGRELRRWLGVDDSVFYDARYVALMPMGFCYPGSGKSGDLPPRPECAQLWHAPLLESMREVSLTLLIGTYAQRYYLPATRATLTDTVRGFRKFLPDYFPLVHPSPRNRIWMKKNPWFETELLPVLRAQVHRALG